MSAILGLSIAIGGVVFIGWGDIGISADNLKGDLLSVGGTVAVAVHMLIGQKLVVRMPSYLYSLIVFLSAAGVFAIYNLIMGISFSIILRKSGDFPIASSGSYGVWPYFI